MEISERIETLSRKVKNWSMFHFVLGVLTVLSSITGLLSLRTSVEESLDLYRSLGQSGAQLQQYEATLRFNHSLLGIALSGITLLMAVVVAYLYFSQYRKAKKQILPDFTAYYANVLYFIWGMIVDVIRSSATAKSVGVNIPGLSNDALKIAGGTMIVTVIVLLVIVAYLIYRPYSLQKKWAKELANG